MALITLNFYSETLGMQTQVQVILPQKSVAGQIGIHSNAPDGNYKCLYLLHGLSDDQTIWLRRTSIERYASDYGICVVMPFAGRSFYSDTCYGQAYYTYIAKELPARIREFFRVSEKRQDNYIAGLSMGGYGALKIALRQPDAFCAAAGLSPCGDLNAPIFQDHRKTIFGSDQLPKQDDLLYLADQIKTFSHKPRLYIAIGTKDFLYKNCQSLRKKLEACDCDFTYRESPGEEHSWSYWDSEIQNVLKWMFDRS